MVLAVIAVLAVLGFGVIVLSESDSGLTVRTNRTTKALHVAEAGINNYLWHLNSDEDYYATQTHPAQGQDEEGSDRWVDFEDGKYHLDVTLPQEGDSVITIESTGKVFNPEVNRTIKVELRKKSFLSYLYFTDAERSETGSEIWWITGDVVRGDLHTNGDLRISGTPVFEGAVTVSGQIVEGWGYNPDFQKEYQVGVQPLQLPPGNNQLKEEAQSHGYYYYGETTITLNSNGSMNVSNNNDLSTGPTGTVWPPRNGIIYVDGQTDSRNPRRNTNGNAFLSGTLSGRLTVAAKNNVYITDNLVYRNQTEDSQDMLGLVAENFVYVDKNAPNNIEIHAAILAINHSFGVEDYQSPPAKGTLSIKGAIIQKFRGPVGTFNSRTMRKISGYSKNYSYEKRMKNHQPPYFVEPVNASFEQVSWEEVNR